MARPLGSGPIHVYLGFGPPALVTGGDLAPVTSASAVYYGTTREGPDITEQLDYYPVMNDLTGPKQSMDDGFAGREDMISLVMSSWTQSVDTMLERFLRPGVGAAEGTDRVADLGTLMVSEGRTVGLWLVKAASAKAINIAAGMPRGRYYYTCVLAGPNKVIEGNKENLRVRIFKAKKNINALNTGFLPLFSEAAGDFSAGMLSGAAATFG